jgi:hypothetical protein
VPSLFKSRGKHFFVEIIHRTTLIQRG